VALRLNRMTDRQLLDLRLCDLPLHIKGTHLEQRVEKLYRELDARSLAFRPHIWLSEEWFTPDGVAGFAIPFYLAHPRLMKLERAQMLEVEGAGEPECMRILRHEAGHAIDNAFRLHSNRTWSDTFGSYRVPYPEWYQPQPGSRDYVLNLDAWYAQAHPAEDFAETFAVWLKPGARWRRQYEGWGALRKLEYVDQVMGRMAERRPPRKPRRFVEPLSALKKTLREHYRRKREYYTIHWPASYDSNLYRIFSPDSRHHHSGNAAQFLRHIRRDLAGVVARGTGVHLYTINHIVRHMIVRCRELNLHLTMPEEDARELTIITLTMQMMQVLRSGYHRIPL
jgi:putative zinc-binding metallo-peptidase